MLVKEVCNGLSVDVMLLLLLLFSLSCLYHYSRQRGVALLLQLKVLALNETRRVGESGARIDLFVCIIS